MLYLPTGGSGLVEVGDGFDGVCYASYKTYLKRTDDPAGIYQCVQPKKASFKACFFYQYASGGGYILCIWKMAWSYSIPDWLAALTGCEKRSGRYHLSNSGLSSVRQNLNNNFTWRLLGGDYRLDGYYETAAPIDTAQRKSAFASRLQAAITNDSAGRAG